MRNNMLDAIEARIKTANILISELERLLPQLSPNETELLEEIINRAFTAKTKMEIVNFQLGETPELTVQIDRMDSIIQTLQRLYKTHVANM